MIKRIQRGRNHTYEIDGEKAMGVTTALGKGLPKEALVGWAAGCVAQRALDMDADQWAELRAKGMPGAWWDLKNTPNKQRDAAAVRGTKVHNLAEKVVHGEPVEVPDDIAGHVEAATKFMDDWRIKPVLVEKTVGHYQYRYAGTFDLIADLPDGRRVLFDYKTSKSGIWPETALQLAAYRWASHYLADDGSEVPMDEVGIQECMAVHVRADGYDVYPLTTDQDVFFVFLNILRVAKSRDLMAEWVGPVAQLPAVAA